MAMLCKGSIWHLKVMVFGDLGEMNFAWKDIKAGDF
jgi:hypothetical protein